jgi:hypothetical protein
MRLYKNTQLLAVDLDANIFLKEIDLGIELNLTLGTLYDIF